PLAAQISGLSRVVVVPDGKLNNVPFGALRLTAEGEPWGASIALSVAPSIQQATLRRAFRTPRCAVVLGDPDTQGRAPRLAGAREEAREVRNLYPEGTLLLARDATLARWLKEVAIADALHFGVHGEINQRFPSRSRLLLAGDGSADLRADALARLKLSNVSLV